MAAHAAHTSNVHDTILHPHHHHQEPNHHYHHQEPNHHHHHHYPHDPLEPLDPPPYPQDPAQLEGQPLNASYVRFNTYHTIKDGTVQRRRRGENWFVSLLGVFIMVLFLCWLLGLALSRRSDLSNDPTDPDGTRHGRGGYGILTT